MPRVLENAPETSAKALEAIPDAVVVLTPDGVIQTANTAACAALAADAGQLVGHHLAPRWCPRFGAEEVRQIIAQGGAREVATHLSRADGRELLVSVNVGVLRDAEGRPELVVFVARNIDDRLRRELELSRAHQRLQDATAQVVQNEKLAAVGRLAAGVAHELNQPLNTLKLITQSILRHQENYPREELRSDLEEALSVITSMQQTVESMLTYTRKPRQRAKDALDLNTLVRRALRLVAEEVSSRSITIDADLGDELPTVTGDSVQLEQVVLNLLANAMDAVDALESGARRIQVRTFRAASVETERVSYWSYDEAARGAVDAAVLEVEDSGVGIPQEIRDRIFEPFFTTKEPGQGTGLGLALAKEIVERHHGELLLVAGTREGALFRVVLPFRSPDMASSPPRSYRYPGMPSRDRPSGP